MDALLMLNADVPHALRIINAKTFEYMEDRRPAFVIAPPGDVWNILCNLPRTVLCEPSGSTPRRELAKIAIDERTAAASTSRRPLGYLRFEQKRTLAGEWRTSSTSSSGKTAPASAGRRTATPNEPRPTDPSRFVRHLSSTAYVLPIRPHTTVHVPSLMYHNVVEDGFFESPRGT